MLDPSDAIDMKSCRICLSNKKPLCPLFKYKLSGNYAEMLTAVADVKVAACDGLPDRICQKCCAALEKAYLLKTVAERTDKKLRRMLARASELVPTKKIAFDSFTDIKSEIGPLSIKSEPKWEMEIDVLADSSSKPIETIDGKNIVIANTVIRKVDANEEPKSAPVSTEVDLTWKSTKINADSDHDAEYLDDDIFQDDDDDDYMPPEENKKNKFKKPKLSEIKVFKGKKPVMRKVKVVKKIKEEVEELIEKSEDGKTKTTMITCYPIMKNGTRGPPILLKRPKDATVLKVHPNYKVRATPASSDPKMVRRTDKPVRMVRTAKPIVRQREKLVCPICGILTFTLGNHIATHQEKKKFSCTQCTRTFSQKSNLIVHAKQHSGVKDHICEICGAGFYSQKSLVRHNLIHKGDRPFPCNLCNKRFIARCDLTRHLRIHSGYKPFKCATCTMSFNAKHQLQNHERMHTGERPYTCQAAALRRHMKIHSGEKNYVCSYCSKSFVQRHHLTNHELTHTGLRPFSCEVCNVAFSYKVNLNNHVFKVHGINLKFKSIHTVTEDVLRREMGMLSETRAAIAHIMPAHAHAHAHAPPAPAAHETVPLSADYSG